MATSLGLLAHGVVTPCSRAIKDNAVVTVRAATLVTVVVRDVAATNVGLHEAVEQERFRRGSLDRFEVLTLRLPPLRKRPGDFPLLVEHFFGVANQEKGTEGRWSGGLYLDTEQKWDDPYRVFR